MGKRSSTETVVAILQALLTDRTCTQIDLARRAGVDSQRVRKHLKELKKKGFPLEIEREHPHVFWSVPKGWFPGAVFFEGESVTALLRQLSRLPRSKARDGLIHTILKAAPGPSPAPLVAPAVLIPQWTESEEAYLPLIEDAATSSICLKFQYFTMSRGDVRWRRASIQSVVIGHPTRFVAFCHDSKSLKWFRLDSVLHAYHDASEPFQTADQGQVEAMLKESVDGFHQGDAIQCSFFVRSPECRWVERNLPASTTPMASEQVPGGLRFTTTTAGVLRLARFVVGLGAAARAETPELAKLVQELAQGALEALTGPV